MNSRFDFYYMVPKKTLRKRIYEDNYNPNKLNPAYQKIMKIIGQEIKQGKEVVFEYANNKITVQINA